MTSDALPRRQEGFTLLELLITILIISLLAAIGLAAYNGQRDKGHAASSKAAVREALAAAVAYQSDHDDSFQGLDNAALAALEGVLGRWTSDGHHAQQLRRPARHRHHGEHEPLHAGDVVLGVQRLERLLPAP